MQIQYDLIMVAVGEAELARELSGLSQEVVPKFIAAGEETQGLRVETGALCKVQAALLTVQLLISDRLYAEPPGAHVVFHL